MLTRTGAKLLDFGLAKTVTESSAPIQGLADQPTELKPLTQEGTILGTFQYMAPEQLEGIEADARTDIFALGAVLYEMASGRRAFAGKTKTSLIASIVASEPPPISNVESMTPPAFDHLVRKCLAKDPDDRWQSAGDLSSQLHWIATQGSQIGAAVPSVTRPSKRSWLPWAIVGALVVVLAALVVTQVGRDVEVPPVLRASLNPPPDTALIPFDELGLSLSPDGRRLAFVAYDSDGGKRIWVRDLSGMTAEAVPGTAGAWYPFWSPDGTHLAFFHDSKLKKIDLRGGSPQEIADAPSGRGGSWNQDDVIIFAPSIRSAIHSVPAGGGTATPITRFDSETETTHRWPRFLPDGKHFFYISRADVPGKGRLGRLVLVSLDDPEPRVLIDDSTNATYVEPGYVVYGRAGDLMARPFDLASLDFTGEPTPVTGEKLSFWEPKDFVPFAAADTGTIVYLPESSRESVLRWYHRTGRPLDVIDEPGFYDEARLSPDGTKVAAVRGRPRSLKRDIWVRDLEYAREYRLTLESGEYETPRWSPDGSRVMFLCQPERVRDICAKTIGSAQEIEALYNSPNWNSLGSWSPDGTTIYFSEQNPETKNDIMRLSLDRPDEPEIIVRTPFREGFPEVSPDGRWILYQSDETGRQEVYLRGAEPDATQQWQLSVAGGREPRWRADGGEIFFVAPNGDMMAVSIQTEPVFRASAPEVLFTLLETPDYMTPLFMDVTPDGQKLLVNLPVQSRTSVGFHTIFNWPSLLD
jgi:Tol biopolymer transport system component